MRTEVRQGLGLLAIAAICLLIALAMGASEGAGPVVRGAAILFAIGGLVLVAIGLLRRETPPS